jgi:hypothetical protein
LIGAHGSQEKNMRLQWKILNQDRIRIEDKAMKETKVKN